MERIAETYEFCRKTSKNIPIVIQHVIWLRTSGQPTLWNMERVISSNFGPFLALVFGRIATTQLNQDFCLEKQIMPSSTRELIRC